MAALQVFEEMQLNAISPDEVSVWAEPQKWQSKNDEDFQGDLEVCGMGAPNASISRDEWCHFLD